MTVINNNNQSKSSNIQSNTRRLIAIGIFIGVIATIAAIKLLPLPYLPTHTLIASDSTNTPANINENKPLYWVAPMDANFRRDKPGQSPMGMDLIPYYGSQNNIIDEGPGTIKISPNVINNLGVRTTTVIYGKLKSTIETVGYVAYDEDKLVTIHPRISGWIEKLYINAIGDPIKKDQPLYDIYSPELINAQEELLLALDRKNKRLITAAKNRLIALKIPMSLIKVLKKDKKVQQNVTFYAPQDGVIESLSVRVGFFVEPETMLLSIIDLSQVWVKAEVFERDIFKVAMGNNASMRLDYLPSKQWHGQIKHIHPMLNPETRTGIIRLHFDNPQGDLKPNMFAHISIAVNDTEPALQVAKEAVIRTGFQDRVVLALGDGYFKSVAVKTGRIDRHNIEIISGISAGDHVVSSAQFLLDSESSKTSDFKRMNAEQHSYSNNMRDSNIHDNDMKSTIPNEMSNEVHDKASDHPHNKMMAGDK